MVVGVHARRPQRGGQASSNALAPLHHPRHARGAQLLGQAEHGRAGSRRKAPGALGNAHVERVGGGGRGLSLARPPAATPLPGQVPLNQEDAARVPSLRALKPMPSQPLESSLTGQAEIRRKHVLQLTPLALEPPSHGASGSATACRLALCAGRSITRQLRDRFEHPTGHPVEGALRLVASCRLRHGTSLSSPCTSVCVAAVLAQVDLFRSSASACFPGLPCVAVWGYGASAVEISPRQAPLSRPLASISCLKRPRSACTRRLSTPILAPTASRTPSVR